MVLISFDGVVYTKSDLASAYNQILVPEDTQKLKNFVFGGNQDLFEQGFYSPCSLFKILQSNHDHSLCWNGC